MWTNFWRWRRRRKIKKWMKEKKLDKNEFEKMLQDAVDSGNFVNIPMPEGLSKKFVATLRESMGKK